MENGGGGFIKNGISSTVNEIHLNYKFAEQQAKRDFISKNKMKKLKKYLIFTSSGRRITVSAKSIVELKAGISKLIMWGEKVVGIEEV